MADDSQRRPALRGGLDHHVSEQGGRRGIVLVDRLGLAPGQAFLPEELLVFVGRFDGESTLAEIAAEVRTRHGLDAPDGFLNGIVDQLDEALLLCGERFDRAIDGIAREFLDGGVRACRHAGSAGYPFEPAACRAALERLVPGELARAPRPADARPIRGLVSPHIDLARGRDGYAAAWSALARSADRGSPPADLFVVFGTGHQGPSAPLTGLPIDWATPLGTTPTDRTFLAEVERTLGTPPAADVLLHRDEHSVEFQVLLLQHLFPEGGFEVAGFLIGSIPTTDPARPSAERWFQRAEGALRAAARGSGKRVCWIAGADLAHLGPFFGDPEPVDQDVLQRLERDERQRLDHLENARPDSFFGAVETLGNPDRVCGTSPILWTATLAGEPGSPRPGRLLHYGQAAATDGSQVVSYCGMAFED